MTLTDLLYLALAALGVAVLVGQLKLYTISASLQAVKRPATGSYGSKAEDERQARAKEAMDVFHAALLAAPQEQVRQAVVKLFGAASKCAPGTAGHDVLEQGYSECLVLLRLRPELGPLTLWLGRQMLGAMRGPGGGTALHDEIVLLNDLLASGAGKALP